MCACIELDILFLTAFDSGVPHLKYIFSIEVISVVGLCIDVLPFRYALRLTVVY